MTILKLYTTAAEIDAACISFFKRGQVLESEAHKLACSVLRHVGEYGDIRIVAKFLASFPDMARVNAVRAWFEAHGPITFEGNRALYVKGAKTRLGEAIETPFWKFKPEGEYKPVNAASAIEALIKRLQSDTKKIGADHSATIQALRLIVTHKPEVQDAEFQDVPGPVLMLPAPSSPAIH